MKGNIQEKTTTFICDAQKVLYSGKRLQTVRKNGSLKGYSTFFWK